jgi:hypothetical protein
MIKLYLEVFDEAGVMISTAVLPWLSYHGSVPKKVQDVYGGRGFHECQCFNSRMTF